MITYDAGITTPELTEESRALLTREAKKLDVQRAVTRLTRNAYAGIMARQLLYFDDKKKLCEDNWVFKGPGDWDREEGITRSQVRTANAKLVEHGLAEIDTERRNPTNNNKTTFYRLNVYRVMQLADPATLERLEPELRYLDPDFEPEEDSARVEHEERDDLLDLDDIPYCDCASADCEWCAPYGYERVEHEERDDVDDFEGDPRVVLDDPRVVQDDPPMGDIDPPYIQRTTAQELPQKKYDKRSSVFHTGDTSLSLRSPGEDRGTEEQDGTTSMPPAGDSLGGKGSEEQVSTSTPETAGPMPAREAWAMYERGEVSLMELEELCRPTTTGGEVAA